MITVSIIGGSGEKCKYKVSLERQICRQWNVKTNLRKPYGGYKHLKTPVNIRTTW
jgi:hypothetical protein